MRANETVTATWNNYKGARQRFFRYRHDADILHKTAMALGFAALTGVASQFRIPLPFTPVPITLQTFAVLLAGIVLGMRFGGLSQAFYVAFGIAGVPWFQGFGGGLSHLFGPTGGYLVGFVVSAVAIGYLIDRYPLTRLFPVLVGVLILAHGLLIYGFGLSWLYVWLTVISGGTATISEVLTMGLWPFVPGDIVKLVAAAVVGTAITPLESSPSIEGPSTE